MQSRGAMKGTTMVPRIARPNLWTGQWLHLGCLVVLLFLVVVAWQSTDREHPWAFWTAVAIPVVDQFYVWLAWRLELSRQAVSRHMDTRPYLWGFFILLTCRPISAFTVA